jgi:hypothetical protein
MAHHRRFHRVRHHAGRAGAGAKGTVLGVASGAAAAIVAGYSQAMIPFLQTAGWWVMPAALALVGHFLKRRNPVVGGAVIGIAGYQAYGNFVAAKAVGAKGFSDAGAMPWSDAGAMVVGTPTSYIDSPGTVASLGTTAGGGAGMLYTKEAMGVPLDAGELYD